jgi:hypothetical protein
MLDAGRHVSVSEVAVKEKIDPGHVGNILRLTLLAPPIVEGVLDGRETELTLPVLLAPWPVEWEGQRTSLIG